MAEILSESDLVVLGTESLKNAVATAKSFKERSIVQEIREYFSKGSKMIFVIRGMRKTGKTIALLQACENPDKTIFVSIRRGCNGSIHQLITLLLEMRIGPEYCLMIDGITELKDVLTGLHFLYDVVPCKRIIVTGSNSLVLNNPFIEKNNLMRVYVSHNLNYISLEEWCTLTGSKDYEGYVRGLCTLMKPTDEDLITWFKVSLLGNIKNSLNHNSVIFRKYPLEFPLLAVVTVLLQSIFGTEIYTKDFKHKQFSKLFDLEGLDSFLAMRSTNKDKFVSEMYWATKMLEDIDCVVEVPLYNSVSSLRDERANEQTYVCTLPYIPLMMKGILTSINYTANNSSINDSAIGTEFKNFVIAQIISINKVKGYPYKCGKFRSSDSTIEFDLVLEDVAENFYAIEVKHSDNPSIELSNLENREKFSKVFDSSTKKICIYRGDSFTRTSANGSIDMVNVTDFFCKYFPKMLQQDPYCPDEDVMKEITAKT